MRLRTLALLSCAAAMPLGAQEHTVENRTGFNQKSFCLWPHPRPECRSYLLVEFRAERPVLSTMSGQFRNVAGSERPDYRAGFSRYGLTVGGMVNRSDDHAVGIAASFALDENGLPSYLELRRHRWVGHGGLFFSGGLATRMIQRPVGTFHSFGVTGGAGAETRYLGVTARADLTYGDARPVTAVLLGAHSTTRTTPVVGALVTIFGLAAAFLYIARLS